MHIFFNLTRVCRTDTPNAPVPDLPDLAAVLAAVVSSFYTLLDVGKEANEISVDVELARRTGSPHRLDRPVSRTPKASDSSRHPRRCAEGLPRNLPRREVWERYGRGLFQRIITRDVRGFCLCPVKYAKCTHCCRYRCQKFTSDLSTELYPSHTSNFTVLN